jgi:arylsulfatase A-like enzyme
MKSCLLSLVLCMAGALAAESRSQPNVIFILADDLGYTDLGCFGSKYYETPHLDKLAAQGMKMMSHHHCQNCQPTRAALMTGLYGPRTGIYTVGEIGRFQWQSRPLKPVENVTSLPLQYKTVAQMMQRSGYATAMFGKWHLGEKGEYHPSQRGFDEAIVSAGQHFNFSTNPKTESAEGAYLADFLTDKAVDFMKRKKEKPFFLYLPHYGVHAPHHAKEEWIAKFRNKPTVGGHNNPVYAAMIASVDESVGRIMATLEELKLVDDTVLIFSSDNGGVGGYEREGVQGGSVTDNAPLRSGKGSLYEGGTRVPFIVRWPGKVQPGSSTEVPTTHVDFLPTLLDLAGKMDQGADALPKLDGLSLLPLWTGEGSRADKAIFQHFPGYLGAGGDTWRTTPVSTILSGQMKLMQFMEDQHVELYDLSSDLGEKHDLATSQPQKAQELLSQLKEWQAAVGAKMPENNSAVKPATSEGKRKGKGKKKKAKTAAE